MSWGHKEQRAWSLIRCGLLANVSAGVSVTTECLSGRKWLIYYGLVAMTFTVRQCSCLVGGDYPHHAHWHTLFPVWGAGEEGRSPVLSCQTRPEVGPEIEPGSNPCTRPQAGPRGSASTPQTGPYPPREQTNRKHYLPVVLHTWRGNDCSEEKKSSILELVFVKFNLRLSWLNPILIMPQKQGCHGTGKTGNLKVHFSRQGKHREFAKKYLKYVVTQGIYHQHRENLSVLKKKENKELVI